MYFSIVIPVFNRPDEVDELLRSLVDSEFREPFEIVLVEDGSTILCKDVAAKYSPELTISYYFKNNSGPGDSRNFGMKKAKGDYFIIFDSDCIIPKQYLSVVAEALDKNYVDCFGGPDQSHESFTQIQKAVDFAMTSFLTTGGIRGGSENLAKFQPRSFNMGISRKAFNATQGFGNIHPGEDPDLSMRLWKMGFDTILIPQAYVYHKRRISWQKFFQQVNKFGKARPILNSWHPEYKKLTFFLPTLFILGFCVAILLMLLGQFLPIAVYLLYFLIILIVATLKYRNIFIGVNSVIAAAIQFYGYGTGFLKAFFQVEILKRDPREVFPKLFFKV